MRAVQVAVVMSLASVGAPISEAMAAGLYDEFAGQRSEAMGGAHRGLGNSNDAIFLNPAGMIMTRRYSVDTIYAYESLNALRRVGFSAVDSKTGPIAGSLAYTFESGDNTGRNPHIHRIHMGAAYPITANLGFGVTARHFRGSYRNEAGETRELEDYSGDFGVSMALAQGIGLGFTYHNIVRTSEPRLTPPKLGFGVGWNADLVSAAFDVEVDMRHSRERKLSYHGGMEYFAAGRYPLRLGYSRELFVRERDGAIVSEDIVSGGLGWTDNNGALEATFTRSLRRVNNWQLIAAFKFFL